MIEQVRKYISQCPYLDEFTAINVDYLVDKVKAYSINENSSYDPVINEDLNGNKECIFKFNFDAKLYWNEEISNNINNSIFFENFRNWVEQNDNNEKYPNIADIIVNKIKCVSNGYIFNVGADEAIYRISLEMEYMKLGG